MRNPMSGRASRFKRKSIPEPLSLQPRDREIIVATHALKVLTRDQIQRLFNMRCDRRANMRLRKLFDHGYLSRQFLPTVRGSGKALYFLGKRGVSIVSEELGVDPASLGKRVKELAELKKLHLRHHLQLTDIRIAFIEAVQQRPGVTLERWLGENDYEHSFPAGDRGRGVLRRFRPDGYLRLFHGKKLYGFFLELDRSTMTHRRFRKKALIYEEYLKLGHYRKRFGLSSFRVLVVTLTTTRLENLKKELEAKFDPIFWFSTLDRILDQSPLAAIWQRAGETSLFPLIR